MNEDFNFEEEKSILLDMESQNNTKLFPNDESMIIESNNLLREINSGNGGQ
jgi:hypothetical protein